MIAIAQPANLKAVLHKLRLQQESAAREHHLALERDDMAAETWQFWTAKLILKSWDAQTQVLHALVFLILCNIMQ